MSQIIRRHWHKTLLLVLIVSVAGYFVLFGSQFGFKTDVVKAESRTITCDGSSRTLTVGTYTDAAGTTFESGSDLVLDQGSGACTFTLNGTISLASLNVGTGVTLTHSDNITAQTYILDLDVVGDVTVSGTIDVTAKGYTGGRSDADPGDGPGGGLGHTNDAGAGGAYGGYGGGASSGATTDNANVYGDPLAPADMGSGGGQGNWHTSYGGDGGGLVQISATTLTVSGSIIADGGNGTYETSYGQDTGGGGSGGGIYLDISGTANLSGAMVRANGGLGYDRTSDGGHGGGGRIAIVNYTSYTAPTTLQAKGGTSASTGKKGGAGSVFLKEQGTNGTLIFDNGGISSTQKSAVIENTNHLIDELVVRDGAYLIIPTTATVTSTQSTFSTSGIGGTLYVSGTFDPGVSDFTFPSGMSLIFLSGSALSSITSSTIAGSMTINSGTTQNISQLTVASGATLTLDSYTTSTVLELNSFVLAGTLTHTDNTTAQTHIVSVSSTNFTVDASGTIDVSAKGYIGGRTDGASGSGPGGGLGHGSDSGAGGAYGGYGGGASSGATTDNANVYGNPLAPTDMGSGGGQGDWHESYGGDGGGFVQISATTLAVSGSIIADGGNGAKETSYHNESGGGGSGGGIYFDISGTANFSGATIRANGGLGYNATNDGGHGGGGRIAIVNYTSYIEPSTLQAKGGTSVSTGKKGGAGSIFLKEQGTNGTLIFDAVDVSTTQKSSFVASTEYSVDELVAKNGAYLVIPDSVTINTSQGSFSDAGTGATISLDGTFSPNGTEFNFSEVLFLVNASGIIENVTSSTISGAVTFTYGMTDSISNLTINDGGTLTLSSYTTANAFTVDDLTVEGTLTHTANTTVALGQLHVVSVNANNVTIGAGGSINVGGKGYYGGQTDGLIGQGTGAGAGNGTYAGGGAGYGGVGGRGGGPGGLGGIQYGISYLPEHIGSGGGSGGYSANTSDGGGGGGLIYINSTNLTVLGSILANGDPGYTIAGYSGGGGSGGSIYLNVTGTFSGTGDIFAKGGSGGTDTTYDGGGGGGGRIAVDFFEGPLSFAGSFSAIGGSAFGTAVGGSVGTVYIRPDSYFSLGDSYTASNWPGSISGTSTDHEAAVAQVDLKIQRSSDSKYWDGSDWSVSETWVTSTGTSTWSYTFSGGNLSDGIYTVNSRATDTDGEVESILTSSSFTFTSSASAPPVSGIPAYSSQATDASGYVTFTTEVSDPNYESLKLRIDYSDDGGITWFDPDLVSVSASVGSTPDLDDANVYQIGTNTNISTAASNTLSIVWDTKSANNTNGAIVGRQSDIMVRVLANDIIGEGDGIYSTSTEFTVDNSAPSSPGTASVSFADLNASVFWSAVTEEEFNRYEIWYGTSQSDVEGRSGAAQPWTTSSDANLSSTSTTNTIVETLDLGVEYFFQVFAFDDFGNYSTSTATSGVIVGTAPTATAPTSTVQAADGTGYVTFETDIIDTDTTNLRFKVQHSVDGGESWLDSHISSVSQTSGSSTISNDAEYPIIFEQGLNTLPVILLHNEDSGGSITDSMGNYTGTYTGALYSQAGKFNNALGFDGSNDAINLGRVSELDSASAFTVMGWYKQTTLGSFDWLFLKGGAAVNPFIGARTYDGPVIYNYVYGSSNSYVAVSYASYVTAGQWFHYAMVYDGANAVNCSKLVVYINGVARSGCSSTVPATTPNLSAYDLTVSYPSDAFAGSIDEFAVYDVALSAEDIAGMYNSEIVTDTYSTSSVTIVWDSLSTSNAGGSVNVEQDVLLRVTPNDSLQNGTAVTSSFSLDNAGPANLTTATAEASGSSVTVSWDTDVADTNFDRYEIWYGTSSTEVVNRTGEATPYTTSSDANLQYATTTQASISLDAGSYSIMVYAFDEFGNYSTSSVGTVTILGDAPIATAPTSTLQSADGDGYVTFSTSLYDSDTQNIYGKIEYSTDLSNWYSASVVSVSGASSTINNENDFQILTEQISYPENPLLYYNADDASGDMTIDDQTGNGKNATYNGALFQQSGNSNLSLGLDGTDDTIVVPNLGITQGTISLWVNPDSVASDRRIWGQTGGAGSQGGAIGFNSGGMQVWTGSTWLSVASASTVSVGSWQHLLFTYSGSQVTAYVNGVQKSTQNSALNLNGVSFAFGGKFLGTAGSTFDGLIDDIFVYDRVLNSSEISQLYSSSASSYATSTLSVIIDTQATATSSAYDGTLYLRVTPNDSLQDGTAVTSSFVLDNASPTNLADFTVVSTSTEGNVEFSWTSASDTNFNRYEIWYGGSASDVAERSGSAVRWTTSSDSNLVNVGATTTTITSAPGGTIYYSLFALDSFANVATTTQVSTLIEREFISTQTGDWDLGTTWGGVCEESCTAGIDFPTSTDAVTVTSTHIVTIPTATTASFSTLNIRDTATLKIIGSFGMASDIIIENGATLQQENTTLQTISGTLTVENGGIFTHSVQDDTSSAGGWTGNSQIYFVADTIDIQDGGLIHADAKGFTSGIHPANGRGTGGGLTPTTNGGGGGGAYGGAGGTGASFIGGSSYGSASNPVHHGSGGGGCWSGGRECDGDGGGLIQLSASTVVVNGIVRANGQSSTGYSSYGGGGGSGGSVNITVSNTISGTGSISVDGGNGYATSYNGGGGGGGRIAIIGLEGALSSFTSTFTKTGGSGPGTADDGGVGTLYIAPDSTITNLTTSTYTNFSWSGAITGTTTDHDDTVSNVHLRIQRSSDSQYWNGSTWGASEAWVTSTLTAGWSYSLASENLTDGVTYTISSRATDSESEVEVVYDTATFSYSTEANTAPTATTLTASQIVSSTARGIVYATTTVSDSNLQDTSIYVDYSLNNGIDWASSTVGVATISGQSEGFSTSTGQITGIDTSAGEKTITFIWYAYQDEGAQDISSAQLRVIPNDGTENGSTQTSESFNLDTNPPGSLASFVVSSYTSEQVHLTWASSTDTNFDHYEIWYGTMQAAVQGRTIMATEWDDSDDAYLLTASTASTTITGLSPGTYYFKIFAIDDFYNESTLDDINTTNSNVAPSSTISVQPSQSNDGTQIISLSTTIQDTDATQTSLLVEHSVDAGDTWTSSTILSVSPDSGTVTTSSGQILGIDTDLAVNSTVSLAITLDASVNFADTSNDNVLIRVTPQDSYANGTAVTSSAFIVDTVNPSTPGSFTFSSATTSTLTFTYGSASTEDHFSEYKVYYTQASSGVTVNDTEVASSTDVNIASRTFNSETNFTIPATLNPNLPYTITIKAFDTYGNVSSLATEVTGYTNPSTPTNLQVSSVDETTLAVSWDANSNANGTTYYLAYDDDSFVTSTTATSTNVTIETPAQEYTFKVRAQYSASTTQYSSYSTTASGSSVITPPNIPTGVSFSAVSTTTFNVLWTDTNSYEDNYLVYLDTTEGEFDTLVTTTSANVTSTSVTNLTPNQIYYITVVAQNSAGSATSTPQVSTTTISLTPDAPTGLELSDILSNSVILSWTDANTTTNATDNFVVKYGTSTEDYTTTATTTASNITSTTISGLSANTEYFFVVLSVNEAGTATSSEISGTTEVSAASAPTNLLVSNNSTSSITLSWDDVADNETAQTVWHNTTSTSFSSSTSVSANVTSTSITGLTPNTQYYFKVRATNAGGSNDSTVTTTYTIANTPNDLALSNVSYDRVTLSWGANSNPVGTEYQIYRTNGDQELVGTTTNTENYIITNLESETSYSFTVRAINADASGYSDFSAPEIQATTAIDPPTAPEITSISDMTSSTAVVNWADNSSGSSQETSFTVKYGITSSTFANTVTTTASDVTSTPVSGLSPNTVYYFVVIATNSSGSTTSTVASSTTSIYVPSAPTNVTVLSTTADTISFSWDDNSSDDTQEAHFLLEWGTDGEIFASSTTVATNETSALLTSLTPNSTYYIRVSAVNSAGSATSDVVSSATSIGLPPKPSELTFSDVSSATLTVTWTDNSSGDYAETAFVVAQTTDGSTYTTVTTTAPNVTSANVTSLAPNTIYVFKVTATNASGSGVSDTETTTTLPLAPAAASGLSVASTTQSSVTLEWSDNTTNEDNELYFTIEISTDGVNFPNSVTAVKDATSRTIGGLSPSTTYYFRVAATNSAGSSTSDPVTATTAVGAPIAPTNLAGTPSTSTLTLTWTDNSANENEEDNFYVYYGTDGINYGTLVTTTNPNVTSAEITGLTPGRRYYFMVKAKNTTDEATSQDLIVSMLPANPATPGLANATATTLELTLEANGNYTDVDYAIYNESTSRFINTVSNEPSLNPGWQTADQWGSPITISGLAPNSQHIFQVRARNANGDYSNYSTTSSLYTLAAIPTRLTASVASSTGITLTWNANSNPSGTVYEIYDYTNTTVITTTTQLSYSLSDLEINTGYRFQVRAENAGNPGTYSDYTSPPTTLLYTLATNPNSAVLTNITATSFDISLSDSDTNPSTTKYAIRIGASSYLQSSNGSLSASTDYQTESMWDTPTYGTYSALTPNTQYSVTLRAQNGNTIPTSFSNTTSTYTLAQTPTELATSSVSQTAITLTWNGGDNPNTTDYTLANSAGTTITTTTAETYTYENLVCATEYTFKVKATNANSIDTSWTDTLTVTTSACDAVEEPGGEDNDGGEDSPAPQSGAAAPPPSVSIPLPVSLSVSGQAVNIDTTQKNIEGDNLLVEADIVEAKLKPKTGFRIPLSKDIHTVQLLEIKNNVAILEVRSNPIRVSLKQKQEAVVDTDEDQIPDLHIFMKDISLFGTKATAVVTNLHKLPISLNNHLSETTMRDIMVRLISIPRVTHVALSEDKNFEKVSYVPFEETRTFRLSTGYGKKTVYVKFRTVDGAEAMTAASITLVKATEIDENVSSCPLKMQSAYKTKHSTSVYYITEQCTKRPFASSDVFFTYFNSWSDVQLSDDKSLISIPNDSLGFMPWGPNYDPKYGALVKTVTDPKVYLLLGTEKYWITSEAVFNKLNYQWNWIEDIDQRLLDKYSVGSEINYTDHHPNYTLVKYKDNSKVYRLEPASAEAAADEAKQIKRHIPDEKTFLSLNFRFDRIVTIADGEKYLDGEPLGESTGSVQGVERNLKLETGNSKVIDSVEKYHFTKTLQLGDYDPEVIELQKVLKEQGYFHHPHITDFFGPVTEDAVKQFQQDHGLDPIGVVGSGTRGVLNDL